MCLPAESMRIGLSLSPRQLGLHKTKSFPNIIHFK
ncbi:hypothetical protein M5D96_001171 [Drosophila gunungcola]|uniref:Uncharacterized protein n=1 Tax=Drosophila gunungcola TaxID=103775 RepID=A0A9P9YXM7_9MUSC|nr:hypothetical protein M5D96_001171 [Drosophila gunungcola]